MIERVDGRVELIAGMQPAVAVARARAAENAGAAALMITPARGDVVDYYRRIAEAVTVPIIVQDAGWGGIQLPSELLRRVADAAPPARHVKVEVPPTAPKITELEQAGLEAIGGAGGLYLLEELDRGVRAVLPGCAYARAFVAIVSAWEQGRCDEAEALFERLLPLGLHLAQGDLFVAVHKRALWRRGVIASQRLRHPAHADRRQLEWADRLAAAAGIDELA